MWSTTSSPQMRPRILGPERGAHRQHAPREMATLLDRERALWAGFIGKAE
jgi:hypothetical protein